MKKGSRSQALFSHSESRMGFYHARYQPVHTLRFRFRNPQQALHTNDRTKTCQFQQTLGYTSC